MYIIGNRILNGLHILKTVGSFQLKISEQVHILYQACIRYLSLPLSVVKVRRRVPIAPVHTFESSGNYWKNICETQGSDSHSRAEKAFHRDCQLPLNFVFFVFLSQVNEVA